MIKIHVDAATITAHYTAVRNYFDARKDTPAWIEKVTPGVMDYINTNFQDIICGTPEIIMEKSIELSQNFDLDRATRDNKSIKKHIRNLISYENFRDRQHEFENWHAYTLADALKVNVCPYCNRQYTSTVIVNDIAGNREYIIKPAFDHFYCRAIYPVLGLSIYNLIPSCTTCNSTLKGEEDFTLEQYMHPFIEGFDNDGVFTFTPQNANGFINPENDNVEIRINSTFAQQAKRERIENNTRFFAINKIYTECHIDLLNEIVQKSRENAPEYFDFLIQNFDLATPNALYRYLFSNYLYQEDYLKRPLSKFTKDIATGLGIIDRINRLFP